MVNQKLFARNLIQQVLAKAKETENVAFSPASLLAVLSMAAVGANGKTFEEFADLFGEKGISRAELSSKLEAVVVEMAKDLKEDTLTVANNMFIDHKAPILAQFTSDVTRIFNSELTHNDAFFADATASADIINKWVAGKTQGKITDLINPSIITPLTTLILVNAIYFKGTWESTFSTASTQQGIPFQVNSSTTSKVAMMNKYNEHVEYGEDSNAKWVRLPYKGPCSAIFVLPQKRGHIQDVAKAHFSKGLLSTFGFESSPLTFATKSISLERLAIPRFNTKSTIDFKDHLIQMGLSLAFSDHADFTAISSFPLRVSAVVQQAGIEVDEEGTVAFAASALAMDMLCMRKPEPKSFVADEPFFFLIEYKGASSSSILFAARISNPSI